MDRSLSSSDFNAALSQLAAVFGSLSFDFKIRPREASRSAVQPLMYGFSTNAVPLPVPILTQTFPLMPGVRVDNTVANEPSQRLTQPLPTATQAATNLTPSYARPT